MCDNLFFLKYKSENEPKVIIQSIIYFIVLIIFVISCFLCFDFNKFSSHYFQRLIVLCVIGIILYSQTNVKTKAIYMKFDENKNILLLEWSPQNGDKIIEIILADNIESIYYQSFFRKVYIKFKDRKTININFSYMKKDQKSYFVDYLINNYSEKINQKNKTEIMKLK